MLTTTAYLLLTSTALSAPSGGDGGTDPDYDFQWATITHPGNEPFPSEHDFHSRMVGDVGGGVVNHTYRMSKLEVTSGQWMEFLNAFVNHPPNPYSGMFFAGPNNIGAVRTGNSSTGYKWIPNPTIPNAEMLPVGGISWRDAALFANWLHNHKSTDFSAILSGAYDTSSWGVDPNTGKFTDDTTHMPGARFWIPDANEWLKAAYWDPNKNGLGDSGWWLYPNSSDTQLTPGLPGETGAQTSARIDMLASDALQLIPIGAYPDQQSPWGLLDVSGGAMEWLEPWYPSESGFGNLRLLKGHPAGRHQIVPRFDLDRIDLGFWWQGPGLGLGEFGLRLASAVPSPSSSLLLCGGTALLTTRRRT